MNWGRVAIIIDYYPCLLKLPVNVTTTQKIILLTFLDANFAQKMTKVLTKKNYDKVWSIVKYLDAIKEITPQEAESIIKKSKSTTYRYLSMLVETGYVEVSGNTNNAVYKLLKK